MGPLGFFTTGNGVFALGVLAALIVLLWDWRAALGVLLLQQLGLAALAVGVEGVPAQMMLVQTFVIGLCCAMLATSALQVQLERSGRQSGSWFFRLLVLALLTAALWSLDLTFVLPDVSPAIARLFGWLGLVALLMLSLGDSALFTAVALLLWCVLGYAVAAFYAPLAEVMVVIGLVELAIALTCSYLILAERLPRAQRKAVLTDVAFPSPAALPTAAPAAPLSQPGMAPSGLPLPRDRTQLVDAVWAPGAAPLPPASAPSAPRPPQPANPPAGTPAAPPPPTQDHAQPSRGGS